MTARDGWWFFTCGNQILLIPQGHCIPHGQWNDLALNRDISEPCERFAVYQSEPCYRVELTECFDLGFGQWFELRETMSQLNAALFDLAGKAIQFALFLDTHRFCGRCSKPFERVHWELALQCEACGFRAYPRVSPSIIVLVRKGKQILLANHRRHQQDPPMFTTLAGFIEAGETAEQAVVREVYEESGIKVNNLNYFDSQPWAFPHSLMLGYFADYESGHIRLQKRELSAAHWFDVDNLPLLPPHGTIARRLIECAVDQIKQESDEL
ncbi:NAD(+) diphosphatase [Alginatibacterium sediminis]|uniref:NAD(+) diphosphatase n=2 Tax=Alginatibacterium sediminis TaxID=2164068 RepID=A0A420E7Y6_9ALTE|nr:NAD(+) diphosphatase [Alginatibacterium sediminis]